MICIYHNDADGMAAAAVVCMYFEGREVILIPAQYGDEPPYEDILGEEVVIVDFSYKREQLLAMHEKARSLIVLDHHKSAEKQVGDLDFCEINTDFAGCILAWDWYFPYVPTPQFLLYVQDRDLWKFDLLNSREFSAGLQTYPLDVQKYQNFLVQSEISVTNLVLQGRTILHYQEKQIEEKLANGYEMIEIAGYTIPCLNHSDPYTLSEICQRLAVGHPFAACYFDVADSSKRVFSLRSRPEGIDVSEVAQQYGGGGHQHAAGFSVPRPKIL